MIEEPQSPFWPYGVYSPLIRDWMEVSSLTSGGLEGVRHTTSGAALDTPLWPGC